MLISCGCVCCAGTDSAIAVASLGTASLAMQSYGQLLEDLLPAGEGQQQPKIVDVLTDSGQKLGTATLYFAGPDAVFHNHRVGPQFAVVAQLSVTDAAAAQAETGMDE